MTAAFTVIAIVCAIAGDRLDVATLAACAGALIELGRIVIQTPTKRPL